MRTAILAAATAACALTIGATTVRADARFLQKPVGAALPSAAACRDKVFGTSYGAEVRPANALANNRTGGAISVQVAGASAAWNGKYAVRIKGDLSKPADRSTKTAEALDWAACKWGLDSHIVRAFAVQESAWRQTQLGDYTSNAAACARIGKAAPCYQSYSLVQVKGTVHIGTYPLSAASVPFAADFASAFLHACYNGAFGWLGNGYRAGDIWGCVGTYFAGSWYTQPAKDYMAKVRNHYTTEAWTTAEFVGNP
jgi:autotransporter family porin